MKYLTTVNGKTFTIDINQDGQVTIDGDERNVDFQVISEALVSALIDNQSYEALVEERDGLYNVLIGGELYEVEVTDERQQRLLRSSSGLDVTQGDLSIRSPMPGLIVAVSVAEGESVNQGDSLCVLESMKMENDIKAPRAGLVGKIHVAKGDRVEQNKILLTLT
ncbi:MAG: biotin/lipoyl-containing protein [Chloroflexota bacterium]